MKRLAVHYRGWGEDWPLGSLADDGRQLLFEYSEEALAQGLELSPINLALSSRSYGGFPRFQMRLPGLIADSLPDGWGLLLMDRLFRQNGVRHPGPLDRLAFIGDRAMGALRFAPAQEPQVDQPDWGLLALARESEKVLAGEASDTLPALAYRGGSPQGARPKALVQYDTTNGQIDTRTDQTGGEPWLVKFPARGEHKEVCAVEQLYAELARDCGLDMPTSTWFDLSADLAAFGVARFDREGGKRVPLHSLAGLLDLDYRAPGSADYTTLLQATRLLTRDEREVRKAYARAVFNVLFHNRDDHPKNFAWRLAENRRWYLAPAYDLTFSEGPGGQHHIDICGEGSAISRDAMRRLAKQSDIPIDVADSIIDQQLSQAVCFPERAAVFPLRSATFDAMRRCVAECAGRLRA